MASGKNVIEVTDANFESEVVQSKVPVLVDFSATWCGPCKQLAPIVDKIADEGAGKYKVVAIDIDDSPAVTQKFGVRGVPTLMLNARNDPFLPEHALPAPHEVSACVVREFPDGGGHAGFASGRFPGRLAWLPQRMLAFFAGN